MRLKLYHTWPYVIKHTTPNALKCKSPAVSKALVDFTGVFLLLAVARILSARFMHVSGIIGDWRGGGPLLERQ